MRRSLMFGLAVVVLFACTDDDHDQFRDDVIGCEEAAAHLESCCPGLVLGSNVCTFSYEHNSGCGSETNDYVYPAFTDSERSCILARSCADLVAGGICERARNAPARRSSMRSGEASPPTNYTQPSPPAVCP